MPKRVRQIQIGHKRKKTTTTYLHHRRNVARIQNVYHRSGRQLEAQLQAQRERHEQQQRLLGKRHRSLGVPRVWQRTGTTPCPAQQHQAADDHAHAFDPVALRAQVVGALRAGVARHRRVHTIISPAPLHGCTRVCVAAAAAGWANVRTVCVCICGFECPVGATALRVCVCLC